MRKILPPRGGGDEPPTFYSVAETAHMLRMSDMTLYRAIGADEFPAVRVRGRLIVPACVIDEMIKACVKYGRVVDAADWVRSGDDARYTEQGVILSGVGSSRTGGLS
ncbi:MAG: helix-turn-helix domain-containing protein [Actinomycetales bacterium]|nr:helix-turn-helix domain-containing protein [Actinomycetales bacterium]